MNALTVAEIASALCFSKQAVQKRAHRESWKFVRAGNKNKYPLPDLPKDVKTAVQQKAINAALPVIAAEIAAPIMMASPNPLTDKQRLERDARAGVKAAIMRTMAEGRCSQEAAMHTLLTGARTGRLDLVTANMLRQALDTRGRGGDGLPSIRTLKRWLSAKDLTPKKVEKDLSIPPWANLFLSFYQRPEKPSISMAYDQFISSGLTSTPPSIYQVRRFLDKLGTVTRERGRMGPRELKNIQPFIRRDFSMLEPNDVWSPDGHTFDAEVQHPFHGRPFRPEITLFIDIGTRRATGWSVDLAESGQAVADALRNGVERYGIPAIIYSDNGSGYRNAFMEDETTGLLGRIGASFEHSLPYNSQARGVIERAHQTIWVQGAKLLPGFIGAQMDRQARLEQFKLSRRALKQGGAMPLMPWHLFVQWCEQRINDYNARAHRALGGTSPDLQWRSFEAQGWQPEKLDNDQMATLFRPRVKRVLNRAEIRLFNNIYFARELEEFHGIEAHIAYDIHDASRIWVHLPDGRLICEAQVNGNSRHYFPVPVVEQARQKRAKGRLARVDVKRNEILEELHGSPAITAPTADQIVLGGRVLDMADLSVISQPVEIQQPQAIQKRNDEIQKPTEKVVTPLSRSERPASENFAEWEALNARILAGEGVSEADARWHRSYQNSAQYRAEAKRKAA